MMAWAALRTGLADFLSEQGLTALPAWPEDARGRYRTPVVTVALARCEMEPLGFSQYLGERFREDTKTWAEAYGVRGAVSFALTLYSPKNGGASGAQEGLESLMDLLWRETPLGLRLKRLTFGDTVFDPGAEMFASAAQADFDVLLAAYLEENGTFLGFDVRGGMTN